MTMFQTSALHTRLLLLHLLLWCGGICSLWAQLPDSTSVGVADTVQSVVAETEEPARAIVTDMVLMQDSLDLPIDTTAAVALSDSLLQATLHPQVKPFTPDPIRAMWLALVFPGAGQMYNHKFWKLPVVYGGFLGCAYAFGWNSQMLRDYSQAYLDIMDDDPNTKSYEQMLPLGYSIEGREQRFKEIFKRKKNYFRKYRDLSIFAFAGVYLISVIDAYVDAELSSFDLSRDLSLRLEPTLIETPRHIARHRGEASLGVQCLLTF